MSIIKVVILESAEYDLKELRAYIVRHFSTETWLDSFGKIKAAIRKLKDFPHMGCIPDEIEELNLNQYKQILSGMNRIIYEVRQDVIYIHVIVDARRDFKSVLIKRLLRTS